MSDDVEEEALPDERERGPITFKLKSTGQELTIPTPYLSVSQAQMYVKCPRQYFFRYVLKRKEKPDFARVIGDSGHKALAVANLHKRKTGKDFTGAQLREAFGDHWSVLRKTVKTDLTEKKVVTAIDQGLERYARNIAPDIYPRVVEEKFETTFDGIPVTGFIDLVSAAGDEGHPDSAGDTVLDYKFTTSRNPLFKTEVRRGSLQLATYAAVTKTKKAGYVAFRKDKGDVVAVDVEKKKPRHEATVEYRNVAKGISAGAFPMCPEGSWYCTPKWCGFYKLCRGATPSKRVEPGA